jgi:two-component system chemotaxis sensor kinase CheA
VDRLRGQQEVVIKPLDTAVAGPGTSLGLAGATIMGDGSVVLILDIANLFEGRHQRAVAGGGRTPALVGS